MSSSSGIDAAVSGQDVQSVPGLPGPLLSFDVGGYRQQGMRDMCSCIRRVDEFVLDPPDASVSGRTPVGSHWCFGRSSGPSGVAVSRGHASDHRGYCTAFVRVKVSGLHRRTARLFDCNCQCLPADGWR